MSRRADHRRKSRRAPAPLDGLHGWIPRMRALGVRVEQTDAEVTLTADPGHSLTVVGTGERRAEQRWMWTLVIGHPQLDRSWVIEPESAVTRVRKLVAGQDVLTGDAPFDDAVHVVGETRRLLACLGHRTRDRLTELLPQARLAEGVLRWSAPATGPRPPGLVEIVRSMMAVVHTLAADIDPVLRLRKHMLDDRDPGHRRRAFEQVVLAGHELIPSERRALLRDPDLELRYAAAHLLSDVETLGRLAASAEAPEAMRAGSIDRLGGCEGPDALAALDRAAPHLGEATRLARALSRVLAGVPNGIAALGEPSLIALVEHGSGAAAGRAIDRLGEVGSERAVPALASIADAFFGRRALKERARAAIGRISSRQGGLRRGGLSVAGGDEGALSVTPDRRR